jgi:hypothetical protein
MLCLARRRWIFQIVVDGHKRGPIVLHLAFEAAPERRHGHVEPIGRTLLKNVLHVGRTVQPRSQINGGHSQGRHGARVLDRKMGFKATRGAEAEAEAGAVAKSRSRTGTKIKERKQTMRQTGSSITQTSPTTRAIDRLDVVWLSAFAFNTKVLQSSELDSEIN